MLPTSRGASATRPSRTGVSRRLSQAGLRTPGLVAQLPALGVTMVLLGIGLFAVLVVDLQLHGPITRADMPVLALLHGIALRSSLFIRDVAIFGSYLGEQGILAIGAALALYFFIRRFWTELSMVLVGLLGEGGIWLFLSDY